MLLTLSTTHQPATDLGYLLHKHPQGVFSFALPLGEAHVFYPEATPERCTVALLLELDPVLLSRGKGLASGSSGASSAPLEPYVNDRPYAASSYLSTALKEAFGTAMTGRSKERPELAAAALPFEVFLPALPVRQGTDLPGLPSLDLPSPDSPSPDLLERLFAPLGYQITQQTHLLDEQFPEWGLSPYRSVTLAATLPLSQLLAHLYVLLPVLDDSQHYFVGEAEIDKLLRRGEGWLETHPERRLITRRFLKHRHALRKVAEAQLESDLGVSDGEILGAQPNLNEQRLEAVRAELLASGARSVLDLGCGEGNLLAKLLPEPQFARILGLDVSPRELERARKKLGLDELPASPGQRLTLTQGSLTYRDARLRGYDAAALVEVIEHLDPARLGTLEQVVFGDARPRTVVVTTPNREYNAHWQRLPAGQTRHADHRFEWTRAEFRAWAGRVAAGYGYGVTFKDVGEADAAFGSPTQMAVFGPLDAPEETVAGDGMAGEVEA